MKIKIEQTLHGYKNGHQLLNSSTELSTSAKRLLLIQSDLSGSNIEKGFDTYLTGYPLKDSTFYALARSWYANEMRRPGCVWTQTFLINLSDLGKFPDLSIFERYFKRPRDNAFEPYSLPIEINTEDLFNEIKNNSSSEKNEQIAKILTGLYEYPDKAILYPAASNVRTEKEIYQVWSDQWPRLRRNFTFCSGALAFKFLGESEFDLQVVPENRAINISRESNRSLILNDLIQYQIWQVYSKYPSYEIRSFLWTVGADIPGTRRNMITLLDIFQLISNPSNTIDELYRFIIINYPSLDEAKTLKSKIFGVDSILQKTESRTSEKQLVSYLLLHANIESINVEQLKIEDRFKNLLITNQFSNDELLKLITCTNNDVVLKATLEHIRQDQHQIINLLLTHPEYVSLLLNYLPEILRNPKLWLGTSDHLKPILSEYLKADDQNNIKSVTLAILEAHSDLIWDLYYAKGILIIEHSLNYINTSERDEYLINPWSRYIAVDQFNVFGNWIRQNSEHLHPKIFAYVLIYTPHYSLSKIKISVENWLTGFTSLQQNAYSVNLIYASAALLALGLENSLTKSHKLVAGTFHIVYSYAAKQKIDSILWSIVPKDNSQEDEDLKPVIIQLFYLLGLVEPKKRVQVEDWDYCELLVRTLVNRFVKHSWSAQSFLNSLSNIQSFNRAVNYCLSFKKGRAFLYKVASYVIKKEIQANSYQSEILLKYTELVIDKKR